MRESLIKRRCCQAAVAVLLGAGVVATPVPTSAEGLLGAIFGAFGGQRIYRAPTSAYSSPSFGQTFPYVERRFDAPQEAPPQRELGHSAGYCVRLCDGRYFPVPANAGAKPADMCHSLCPACETKVFFGDKIDSAVARDGTRYSDLPNAFAYRDHLVDGCTCNGKDAFGLAQIDVANDPTLRKGDIVVTKHGLMAYTPTQNGNADKKSANFTPVDKMRLSRTLKEKLATLDVAKPE